MERTIDRQRVDTGGEQIETEPRRNAEPRLGNVFKGGRPRRSAAVAREFADVERGIERIEAGGLFGDGHRDTRLNMPVPGAAPGLERQAMEDPRQTAAQASDRYGVLSNGFSDRQPAGSLAQQPDRRMAQQSRRLAVHGVLGGSGHFVVERLDRSPQCACLESVAGDAPGACHIGGAGAGVRADPADEGRTHAVDQAVGDRRRHDLPPQAVTTDIRCEAGTHSRRKIAHQFFGEAFVLRKIRGEQLPGQPNLGVRQQHGQFRPSERLSLLAALHDRFVIGQVLDGTVQITAAFETADEALELRQTAMHVQLQRGECLALQVVIAQHQSGDFVGEPRE